jgi:hypothetical protein
MMRRPVVRLGCWVLLGLALGSWPALADFRDDYRQGIEALERGQSNQAAILFRQAIAERPDEKARLTRSPFSKRYLPHFFLGEALLDLDDCEGALAAWAESERQGIVTRLPEYQSLVDGREICQERTAARSEAQRRAEVEISNAEAAAIRVDRLRARMAQQWANAGPDFRAKYDEAKQRLIASRAQLTVAVAAEDIDGMRQAAVLGREARDLLEAVERDAIEHQAQLRLQQGSLIAEVESLLERAEAELQSTASLRPYPRRLGRVAAEVAALIDETRQPAADQSVENLRALRAELQDGLARLQAASAPPPEFLTRAATAYFDGEYEEVLGFLDDFESASPRVALQAHLLRAASSFNLYHLGNTGSDDLLESARSAVMGCLAIDAETRPPSGPFSPRFVEFFETQAASAGDDPAGEERAETEASD